MKTKLQVTVDLSSYTIGVVGEALGFSDVNVLTDGVLTLLIDKGTLALGTWPVVTAFYGDQVIIWFAESGFSMEMAEALRKSFKRKAKQYNDIYVIENLKVQDGEWDGTVEHGLDGLSRAFETVGLKPIEL